MTGSGHTFWGDVADAQDTGLIVVDTARHVVVWNAWLAAASGIASAAAIGKPLDGLFPGTDMRWISSAVTQALEAGASAFLTHTLHPNLLPLRTRAGAELFHNVTVRPVGERPYGWCLIQIADITMAVHRERVLRERQNARYDAVMNSASDAILTLDAGGIIQFANIAAASKLGYAENALLNQPFEPLLPDRAAWSDAWKTVLADGTFPHPIEIVVRRRDGSLSYMEATASKWLSNSRVFVTAILRDVNERRAAEEALRHLNQTLERRVAERTADRDRMWRLSTDVMMVAQFDGTITAINPAWGPLFGWTEETLVGADIVDFVAEEDRDGFRAILDSFSQVRTPRLFELRIRTRTNDYRRVAWSAVAADGRLQAVGRDVTAEREAEQALRDAEEGLRQSQKMEAIGQLTGGIAHDFNNLLTGIIGALDLVNRRIKAGQTHDVQPFMDAASASANRAAALTHRLLAFARRQPLDPKAVNANELIRGMEDLFTRSLGEQIRLRTDLAPDLWPTLSDANQLENALLNLAINARDAMPDGGALTISTTNTVVARAERHGQDVLEPGHYTLIEVQDTGAGMEPEVLAKVFEPFFTTKPIGQGTGLGLSMIYGFAKQSRGHVRIESQPGAGTQVRLYLPRHKGQLANEAPLMVAQSPNGSGEAVLLVEDDPAVRLLIGEVLRDLGYACIEAGDAPAALPILASDIRLDLMITDVGLPGMNGRQLATLARGHRPSLKILFVTGYTERAVEQARFLGPGMEMISKPFTLDALAQKINGMIAG
ncbi:PAS domain S-box protein [Aquabacter spiritensis]|uniref:histidine kinase n=1 Tax=Aquabacter spiritensis TaxID=933073 RepID=A0A4R3LMU2_9HYPH|nr:PAS domain S-box protein [Aquabacter spiritensis]TCT01720.1 PAS domain S-box-containing protein [Aquabacter spiritensis]